MKLLEEIIDFYSLYTGDGLLMVLFFVSLIYVALNDENRNNRTILLYGTVVLILAVFCPVFYWGYGTYIEKSTYWRFFWLLPMGIGFSYVGSKLVHKHKVTGFLLILFVMVLGGKLVYTVKADFKLATNIYHIEQDVVDVADFLDTQDIDEYQVAVPFEMLDDIRVYNINIHMPYGREQYEDGWGVKTGFYELMIAPAVDFKGLADKCRFNNTKYLVINNTKALSNEPGDNGFTLLKKIGGYDIYEYMGL